MTPKDMRELANAIADTLFTNGSGLRADRLVLTQETTPQTITRTLGGWAEKFAADQIETVIALRPEFSTEPADAEWAEANGFKWADETGMTRRLSCGWVVVLWGDVADCEKRRGLSLETSSSYVGAGPKNGYKVSNVVSICDDPTRGDVLRLVAALDGK